MSLKSRLHPHPTNPQLLRCIYCLTWHASRITRLECVRLALGIGKNSLNQLAISARVTLPPARAQGYILSLSSKRSVVVLPGQIGALHSCLGLKSCFGALGFRASCEALWFIIVNHRKPNGKRMLKHNIGSSRMRQRKNYRKQEGRERKIL